MELVKYMPIHKAIKIKAANDYWLMEVYSLNHVGDQKKSETELTPSVLKKDPKQTKD